MKYIAVLGSVFLPAGLVAVSPSGLKFSSHLTDPVRHQSLFNVPEFQFLSGAKYFGAYLAITLPLTVGLVVLCVVKPYESRRRIALWRSSTRVRERLSGVEKGHISP